MKIWLISDLHLDHAPWIPSSVPDADVLVVAGDVMPGAIQAMEWLRYDSGFEGPIVYVLGNHEFYSSSIERERQQARAYASISGIYVLDNNEIILGSLRFIGGTLWTDYDLYAGGDEGARSTAMTQSYLGINDHRQIKLRDLSSDAFEPQHAREMHARTLGYIEGRLRKPHAGPTLVVTHHAPSRQSVSSRFQGDALSAAFSSDLEPVMLRHRPAAWLHGHVHSSHDYVVGSTRVVANPRGYGSENSSGFDPGLVIAIPDSESSQP
ncbi:metallophosphoesterase [Devosia sp. Leaf64]|uniref:metallophosphoesterase n=1 Tax=Devosia sp. Leaf64 TaxID=1736229 RepID=UPI00071511D9|nr:metallophosphoesterase [Devosia sp. Leaf64]KQN75030.1 hypothetical protein ASE94_01545 [Devosia sp. Leaf64]